MTQTRSGRRSATPRGRPHTRVVAREKGAPKWKSDRCPIRSAVQRGRGARDVYLEHPHPEPARLDPAVDADAATSPHDHK